ncbi:cytoskeleton-associated protein 2-like [Archocentrus centrarchus]|uniref:cytoskeleton-associated protein 2-like n=1 Tax=Archocentrus centrarchus TaxID=63155 RepID=UPI0011EA269A|nr:cytoskeleton-associated protein 2-like [Archocentrus centrarchus]
MEEAESEPALSRKEMRKQKLMEYLAAKGKLKMPTVRSNLGGDCLSTKPVTSAQKVVTGKENKAPADRFRPNISKGPSVTARSGQDPPKKAFGVRNKGNGSKPTGLQNNTRPALPKPNRNPLLTRTYDDASFKSHLSAAIPVAKQANTRIQTSGRAPLNTAHTARVKSNSKVTFDPSSASSMMMVDARISLGPLVKTKTGLTPAVIQPRATKPNLPHTSVTAASTTTTTQAAKKVRSSTTSSVSVSQRSGMGVPSAARARNKAQGQSKLSSKPALGTCSQISSKSHLSSGLKSASTSLKSTAASLRPAGRGTANKSAGQPANGSTKTGTETKGRENGRPLKAAFQTSSRPTNRCASRPVGGLMQPAVTEMGKKTKITKETAGKTKNCSSKAPPPKAGVKSRSAALVSQMVPPPARTVSLTGKATDTKTPKVQVRVIPQTGGKKPTAAQVERMKKLQEWREAKGISYKRPPMEAKPQTRHTVSMPQPFWASMNEEDEADSLICTVDRSLADCIKLLREGCPPEQVKEVLSRLPVVSQKFSKYWICRARLMEQEGNLDVLPMFEEAVGMVLEPLDELRTVVFDILKKKDEIEASEEKDKELDPIPENGPECGSDPTMTPKPVRALIYGERGGSSVVKYKITATPGGPPSQRRESVKVNGHEVRFFTPVRRSVRIERASLRYPTPLQDHDLCVKSYNDLLREDEKERSEEQTGGEPSPSNSSPPVYIYRENEALKDKVFVQLVCDDTD